MLKRELALILSEAEGALRGGSNNSGYALSKNGARTGRSGTDKLAEVKAEADRNTSPGAVRNSAAVVAVDLGGGLGTERTGCLRLARLQGQGDGGWIGLELNQLKISSSRQ